MLNRRNVSERSHLLTNRFHGYVGNLHNLTVELVNCQPFFYAGAPRRLPPSVVYLFSDRTGPLYVGRSNHFRQRLGNHCRASSKANQSALAFKLARVAAGVTRAAYKGPLTRKALMEDEEFLKGFVEAKSRLNHMDIRYVEVTDQVQQALLEVYAAVVLETPYNGFSTS